MRHQSAAFDALTSTAAFLAIALSLWTPELIEQTKYYIFCFIMLVIGIPHGAVDHIISADLYNLSKSFSDQIKFYFPYLALMFAMGIIWYISPIIGFAIFLLCTIYHFGQADLIHLSIPNPLKKLLYLSRGVMVVGLIIFINPSLSYPVMESIAGLDFASTFPFIHYSFEIGIFSAFQHLLLLAIATAVHRATLSVSFWYPITDTLLIIGLFAFAEPVIAFAVYFGCWHSLGHVKELKEFFSSNGKKWSIREFYKSSWLFTMISIVGLVMLYWLNAAFGSEEQMLALLFILISALTLPHMFVVEIMFKSRVSKTETR